MNISSQGQISNREKREWGLMIFIIPVGIALMLIAGQIAIRIVPDWTVNAGMESSLDPETAPQIYTGLIQPLSADILTPLGWFETFLTPNAGSSGDVIYPEFVVLEPSATPSPSPTFSPTAITDTATPTATTPSPTLPPTTGTPTSTSTLITKTPKVDPTEKTPTPTATTTPATIDPTLTFTVTAISTSTADIGGGITDIDTGTYVVVNISGNPIIVEDTPDGYYDLILYEYNNAGVVAVDRIIIGISHDSNGATYWEVFNWGDGERDTNTNIGVLSTIDTAEPDNEPVALTDLYNGTGILIDVDTARSTPPPGEYNYVVIISPTKDVVDPGAQVDTIIVTEVPLP